MRRLYFCSELAHITPDQGTSVPSLGTFLLQVIAGYSFVKFCSIIIHGLKTFFYQQEQSSG